MGSTSGGRTLADTGEFLRISVLRSAYHQVVMISFMIAILLPASGCGYPPALESENALNAADALYTAITSRRTDLVNAVESDLKQLQSNGQLSAAAMGSLSEIIEKARSGSWQNAAEDLDGLIRNQPVNLEPSK